MNKLELYRKYRKTYGESAQDGVFSEEAGEYLVAKSKYNRGLGSHVYVLEEIADNLICFEQLVLNMADKENREFGEFWSMVEQIKTAKIERMDKRLNGDVSETG